MRSQSPAKRDTLQLAERGCLGALFTIGISSIAAVYAAFVVPVFDKVGMRAVVVSTTLDVRSNTGMRTMLVRAQLENGANVMVSGLPPFAPKPGETIELRERRNILGYSWYLLQ